MGYIDKGVVYTLTLEPKNMDSWSKTQTFPKINRINALLHEGDSAALRGEMRVYVCNHRANCVFRHRIDSAAYTDG